jgi:branched-chain amino acid aminotransferase
LRTPARFANVGNLKLPLAHMPSEIRYLSIDGKVVPYEQGTIHMLTPTIKYGAAVFESVRGYWNTAQEDLYLFRLDDHLRRLQYGMRMMRFEEIFSLEMMRSAIIELIKANDLRAETYIRLFAYLGGEGELTATGPLGLAIAATPRSGGSKASGVHVGVSTWRRLADTAMPARVKCISNYQNSRLAAIEAKSNGYNDALLLNERGKVAEGQTAAFFMVRRGVAATPAVTEDVLEGITRDTVLRILREDFAHPGVERPIDRSELYDADEAFFCATGPEIVPILSIDRHRLGDGSPGALTRKLIARYRAVVSGSVPDYPAWRTPVFS